ncbi:MAG TPA: glycoside hydrolase family 18 protein [Bryobacteraceae bacterium]|jgi:chitinase|nr:glycoside hydrolase family 18 protein [Bryobacteraceae bacterium]
MPSFLPPITSIGRASRSVLAALLALSGTAALLAASSSMPRTETIVNGYFTEWGTYSNYNVKNVITSHTVGGLTHLTYAFGSVVNNRCTLADSYADVQQVFTAANSVNGRNDSSTANALHGNFEQLLELKRLYPNLKIVMSLNNGAAPFQTAAQPQNRKAFVASCIDMFIKGQFAPGIEQVPNIFDGFDIDWEYPGTADRENLIGLFQEFRRQFAELRPGLLLTMAAPAGSWAYDAIDLPGAANELDFFNLMTYDYSGPWQNTTGFVAPLYESPLDPIPNDYTIDQSVQGYFAAGVPASKIVLGIPFYGYGWKDVPNQEQGQFQPGVPVDQGGDAYSYIVTIMSQYKQYRDYYTDTPWLFNGSEFWTYDDPTSIRTKMRYARTYKLRGAMIWELSSDLPTGDLMHAIIDGLSGVGR